jgi:DNA-binding MarR family transcriptional regulator
LSRSPKPPRARPPAPDGESSGLGDALEFLRTLWKLDHSLRLASKAMEANLRVTGPQRLVIRFAGRFPGISAGDLATLMHLDPSSLTSILRRLEVAGFIERRADAKDRRRALVSLTAEGRGIDRPSTGTVEAAVIRTLALQSRASIARTRDLLEALAVELTIRARPRKAPRAPRRRQRQGS